MVELDPGWPGACTEARGLLRAKLRENADAGVRALVDVIELPDDHPSVVAIATMLLATAAARIAPALLHNGEDQLDGGGRG